MDVIALHRKVYELKIGPLVCRIKGASQYFEANHLAQVADLASHPNGHMNRVPVFQDLASLMWNARAIGAAFTTGAASLATPGAKTNS
jgi:hypothetical protein